MGIPEESKNTIIKRNKREKIEITQLLLEANSLFVKHEFDSCIDICKNILKKNPRHEKAYFMLGLVFEEIGNNIKAYNFYLVAAQLMKNNFMLWEKLYDLSSKLSLYSDKLYYIQILQRKKNCKELVKEKMLLYRMLKNKYKVLETRIELFEFDGIDFEIFNIIRNETKHKIKTSVLANCLIRFYKKNKTKCGLEFIIECVRLQFESGYLFGTKNIIEDYILKYEKVVLPNDIRIIYIICVLAETKEDNEQYLDSKGFNKEESVEEYLQTDNICELTEELFKCDRSILDTIKNEKNYLSKMEYGLGRSKTLKLSELSQKNFGNRFSNYSSIENLLKDNIFWNSFNERKHIKTLIDLLIDLNLYSFAIRVLNKLCKISDDLHEYINMKMADIFYKQNDVDLALFHYNKVLELNPDNNDIKSVLYNIYMNMGSVDLANKFKTITNLVKFIDDIENEDKSKYRFTMDKCLEFREIYERSRELFNRDTGKYIEISKVLVEDFLSNNFIFVTRKKFKSFSAATDRSLIPEFNRTIKLFKHEDTYENNIRFLSLHGLDAEEWKNVLIEYVTSKISVNKHKEAIHLLKKTLKAEIFQDKSIFIQFVFLGIRYSIITNNFYLLSFCIKKSIYKFNDYGWSYFYFYLTNFFSEYYLSYDYLCIIRNIKRIYARNLDSLNRKKSCIKYEDFIAKSKSIDDGTKLVDIKDNKKDELISYPCSTEEKKDYTKENNTGYRGLTFFILISSFFPKSASIRNLKILKKIEKSEEMNDQILLNLVLVLSYKSRVNKNKNKMLKEALQGLKKLLLLSKGEDYYIISYNIGRAYHIFGFVGFAERFYKEAIKTKNKQLKRIIVFNLLIIYGNNKNKTLQRCLYEMDEI